MIKTRGFPTIKPYLDFEEDMRTFVKRGFDLGYETALKRHPIGRDADDVARSNNQSFADGAIQVFRYLWQATPIKSDLNCDVLNLEAYLCGWRSGFSFGCQICGCDPTLQSDVSPYLYVPPCSYLDQP